MPEDSWVRCLAVARQRPALYQGWAPSAHLDAGITEPLRLVWDKQAFEDPGCATVLVSPSQYHCRCYAGPLMEGIERLLAWNEWDLLLQAVRQVQRELDREPAEWAKSFCEPTFYFGAFCSLLHLAERGAVGIRTSAGLWCQSYDRGWPTAPPRLVGAAADGIGLLIAAALSPEYCTGLPFTEAAAQDAIPEAARPHVTVEWHPQDDLVPECPIDPHCVLRPENIARWL